MAAKNTQPFNLHPALKVISRVAEKWFCKLGFFFRLEKSGSANSDFFSGSRKVVDQKKRWVFYSRTINHIFCKLEKSGSANLDFFRFERSG